MIRKLIQTSIHAACCLALLIGSAQAQLNLADGTASGQWYNPARDGEGFYVEVIGEGDNLQIAVAMYSYDENGKQLWLVGNAAIADGDVGAGVTVYRIEGPVWGTQYDPADRQTTEFGIIYVRFPSCDTALFDLRSNDHPTLESGFYPLTRLTELVGMDCTNPPPPAGDAATPGQWTGEGICFFLNTEPYAGFAPGTSLVENDLCNGFTVDAEVPGVEMNIKGEEGPACQAKIECSGNWGITYPGSSTFGWATCTGQNSTAEFYFTSATESTVVVYDFMGQEEGTACVGQVVARPAQ